MGTEFSRRTLVTKGLTAAGGVVGLMVGRRAAALTCKPTLPQGEGPFYPEGDLDRDSDLTFLVPGGAVAKGERIFVSGVVTDQNCEPIRDALVEVWQACISGKYNHSGDTNNLALDPNFQYWGRARTDADGKYVFKTIIPGHYPIGGGVYRPPHIHFKVHAAGFQSLTTQMYFNPESYEDLEIKKVVKKWNDYEKVSPSLQVLFAKTLGAESKVGKFDITLRKN